MVLLLVLLLHAEALAVPGQVDDARVRPEGDPGDGVAEDVHDHNCSLKWMIRILISGFVIQLIVDATNYSNFCISWYLATYGI